MDSTGQYGLPGCNAVQFGDSPTLRRRISTPFSRSKMEAIRSSEKQGSLRIRRRQSPEKHIVYSHRRVNRKSKKFQLNPWSKGHLEKLIDAHFIEIFPTTVFRRVWYCTVSWASLIQSTPSQPILLWSILILHIYSCLPSNLFSLNISQWQFCCNFSPFHVCYTSRPSQPP
jgi:hypothetical protein